MQDVSWNFQTIYRIFTGDLQSAYSILNEYLLDGRYLWYLHNIFQRLWAGYYVLTGWLLDVYGICTGCLHDVYCIFTGILLEAYMTYQILQAKCTPPATAPAAAAAPPELLHHPGSVSKIWNNGWILEFKVSKRPYRPAQ